MGRLILITGGARSGKSTFAEDQLRAQDKKTAYIATAIAFDDGMKSRIEQHVKQRPSHWTTFEQPRNAHEIIGQVARDHDLVLLDCMTVLLTNHLLESAHHIDEMSSEDIQLMEGEIQAKVDLLIQAIKEVDATFYLVTNEVGSGIVPEYKLSRVFRDMAGRANQTLARAADEVHFVVSGIPMRIK